MFTCYVYPVCCKYNTITHSRSEHKIHPRTETNTGIEYLVNPKVKTSHRHKDFPHEDNPEKGLCFLLNVAEKTAHNIWLLPWTTRTHTDVIFPTAPSHHSFSPFLSPQCTLIRLDCPLVTSPSGHVALLRPPCPLPPGPTLREWKWPDWCPATLYRSTAPLSSWWLQSCHTAWSIRGSPAVLTDQHHSLCLRAGYHYYSPLFTAVDFIQ